jgi:hypothetical protein
MNTRQRAIAYKICAYRDGQKCFICRIKGDKKTLLICRRNPELKYDLPDGRNWELRCKRCDRLTNPRNFGPIKRYKSFSTIGEMIGCMVDTIFARKNIGINARGHIADRLNISITLLDQMIKGEAPCNVQIFCAIAKLCNCKTAFDWLKEYGI